MKPASLAAALGLALVIALPAGAATDQAAPALVEVQPDPSEQLYDREWVEFANPTPAPVSLEGLYLTDHDSCFQPGEGFVEEYRWALNATVPAQERLVLTLPSGCLNLSDAGDDLALEDEEGHELQSLAYGDQGDLSAPNDGESLSACQAGSMAHAGWEVALQSPGATNQPCATLT